MFIKQNISCLQVGQKSVPPSKFADIVRSTVTIQRAYRRYKRRKLEEDLPDLNCSQVMDATIKIQSAFRGFKARKKLKSDKDDLPDLNAADVAAAALKIQSAYKGFQARKMIKQHKEIMPDLNCAQVQDATIKIQSAYRGFQTRKGMKQRRDSLPDLKAKDVVAATIKIQSAYRGFKTRKDTSKKKEDEEMPDLCDPDTIAAALKIQSAFKGYQVRKVHSKVPLTPQPSIDFDNMAPADFSSNKTATKRVPPVPKRSDTKEMQAQKRPSTSKPVPKDFGVKDAPKSPLPARSSKLKEVPIPSVPSKSKSRQRISSSSSSNFSEAEKEVLSPITPSKKESVKQTFKEAGQKEKEEATKSKIGGFFSSMFKSKPKAKTPESPEMRPMTNVEIKPDDMQTSKEDLKQVEKSKSDSSKISAATSEVSIKGEESNGQEVEDPNLKKDLIHTVLNAVQENWLNQAPKPTLDKAAALQVPDSDPELENSERSTSEADYMKKKLKAQKKDNINSDDEGAQLWKQESADGDLPYVETTLPQEKAGLVTITPAAMRISAVQLASTERPRTTGQRRPGTLSQFVKTKEGQDGGKEPLTVKLPRQESKSKLKTKVGSSQQTWDNFSAAGLQKAVPPKSIAISSRAEPDKNKTWVDCDSLPEKKKQPKKYGAGSEQVKSPGSEAGRSGLQTPTGTQIVSPEECSCDCHQQSPPHTATAKPITQHKHKEPIKATKEPPKAAKEGSSVSRAGSSRPPGRKEPTPPVSRKPDSGNKGAVPKTSVKRPGGPPTPPIRTTSVSKATKVRYESPMFFLCNGFNNIDTLGRLV